MLLLPCQNIGVETYRLLKFDGMLLLRLKNAVM